MVPNHETSSSKSRYPDVAARESGLRSIRHAYVAIGCMAQRIGRLTCKLCSEPSQYISLILQLVPDVKISYKTRALWPAKI